METLPHGNKIVSKKYNKESQYKPKTQLNINPAIKVPYFPLVNNALLQ